MVFNKQICMLICVNQNNGEKINCLKTNLNIKNVNINMKHLRKTNLPLMESPLTRKPGKKIPALHPASIVNPKQVIKINLTFPIYVLHSPHGQLVGLHFLTAALKGLTVFKSLNADSTNYHMSGRRYDILPCP